MQPPKRLRILATLSILAIIAGQTTADEIRVAVASNFIGAMQHITNDFEAATGHRVILIFGSTGKHYAQIKNGAPFDAFFAADVSRPQRLEEEGVALPGSRFTYAIGKVVLWSPQRGHANPGINLLKEQPFRHLAIANPKLAPYGKAAEQVLRAHGLWDSLKGRIVRGENIGQTFQFVKSGNAQWGFVAYSQVTRPGLPNEGSLWIIPSSLYDPIEQQAVLLTNREAALAFMAFVKSGPIRKTIQNYGYDTP